MEGNITHYLPQGTVLGGRYQIIRAIGEGGFGITYLGTDLRLEIPVAVKEYFPAGFVQRSTGPSPTVVVTLGTGADEFSRGKERFLKEAHIIARFLGEPGIVNVTDYFEENQTAYLVMEYLDGVTLKEYLKQNGVFEPDVIFALLKPLMASLNRIHGQGMIHRDISPDNIMLMSDGKVKLLDFGAARDYSMAGQKSLSVVLKQGYAPEEQYRSKGVQGPWTDVYALCATIYKCITGITPDESIQRLMKDEVKWPSQLGVQMEPGQEAALMRGMSVMGNQRFQSMGELYDALYSPATAGGPSGQTRKTEKKESGGSIQPDESEKWLDGKERQDREKRAETEKKSAGAGEKSGMAGRSAKRKGFALMGAVYILMLAAVVVIVIENDRGLSQMSDNPADFTFELEGTVYQLPMPYQVLKEAGWSLGSYEEDEISANSYGYNRITNGSVSIDIEIANLSSYRKLTKDCNITGISISKGDDLDFKIAKGITCTSTKDEILEAYGTPSSSPSSEEPYEYMIYYEYGSGQFVLFDLNTETSTDNGILLVNRLCTEADAADEPPEYLDTYQAPAEL